MNSINNYAQPERTMTIDLEFLGVPTTAKHNAPVAFLVEEALRRGEGHLTNNGALVVETGERTGRSPNDRFIVDTPEVHDAVAWGNVNKPLDPATFEALWEKALDYMRSFREECVHEGEQSSGTHSANIFVSDIGSEASSRVREECVQFYVTDGFAGADRTFAQRFRVICESPAQSLFVRQLLVRPTEKELVRIRAEVQAEPDSERPAYYTVLALPNLHFDPAADGTASHAAVVLDFTGKRILIAGTKYSGEIKKAIFTVMNYLLPDEDVLPMHCSANCDPQTGATAIFFGLSGTGKTTLSASPDRCIIGDDEHGWSQSGIFNFEGGCYAKCINLTPESEPEIYYAIRFGALVENVVMDSHTRELDFFDNKLTDNTRVGYPIDYIPGAVASGTGHVPTVLIFLTADAFGVLPPISHLTPEAAMYHFVTGFTSKVAGTEVGVSEPVPTFSSMFGEPFMPRPASVYAALLGERVAQGDTHVYLVNTGWAGGAASEGVSRIPLRYTRAMINAALSGELANTPTRHDDIFNLDVPLHIADIPDELLNPELYWESLGRTREAYRTAANHLARLFEENFANRHPNMDPTIAAAGPKAQ